jgi:hypothetical protein
MRAFVYKLKREDSMVILGPDGNEVARVVFKQRRGAKAELAFVADESVRFHRLRAGDVLETTAAVPA